jgi:hypothetical protein
LDEFTKKFQWILTNTTRKNVYLIASCFDCRFGHLNFVTKDVCDGIWATIVDEILDLMDFSVPEGFTHEMNHAYELQQRQIVGSHCKMLRMMFENEEFSK